MRDSIFLAFAALLLALATFPVTAQTYSLTAEQQAMLDQLPLAQRQQALQAIARLQQSSGDSAGRAASSLVEPLSESDLMSQSGLAETEREDGVVRAGPGSRLIVSLRLRSELSRRDEEYLAQTPFLRDLEGNRYFVLDEAAILELPGLEQIDLSGLSEDEIQERLSAERDLELFTVSASLLGDGRSKPSELQPFGYTFFEPDGASFAAVTSGPVPPDYVLGPGDSIRVQFFGNVNAIYESEISRDGVLNLPEIGPQVVAGLSFAAFRKDLDQRVNQMLIGTQVSATMGQLRSIRLFVLGDVEKPGSYVVGSLSTISTALYRSGGISIIGSLRNIQLKRNGRLVKSLDLYDLLLKGDSSDDVRLQPGDVVFVPPVGPQVSVDGAVKRPGIYEISGPTSFESIVELAGGFTSDAFAQGARVERISDNVDRRVLNLDLTSRQALGASAVGGDSLLVPLALDELQASVMLDGHVQRPGAYEWRAGMKLTDLISSLLELKPGADANYVLVRRENTDDRRPRAVSANIAAALAEPASSENIRLQPKDTIYVFSLSSGRQRVIEPFLNELSLLARYNEPAAAISVVGEVRAPGTYPLERGMRISDLLRAGGGLSEEAYSLKAEIARYQVIDDEYRDSKILDIDLAAILSGSEEADLVLEPHDNLRISVVPEWDRLWSVTIDGEVRFPGQYRIRDGETLSALLERAGGLTNQAFPEGAVFLRESLRQREQEQIDVLARRLEADLTTLSLETLDTTGSQAFTTGQELLSQLRKTEALGRLVIELEALRSDDSGGSATRGLFLRDGDRLLIPKRVQEVTVIGETQQNTSHLFRPGLKRSDYIELSGGVTRRADKKLIYVVRANGAVETGGQSRWFGRKKDMEIRPGDTIVVPLETDRIRPLTFWASVTQILYQAAIAVAAVDSFSN